MAIQYIANALGGTGTTTSFSITLPTTQAGDILILEFTHRGTGDGTIGGTSGLTWTLKHSQLYASSAFSGKTYWARATGNHGGTTVTGSGLTNSCAAILTVYRGALAFGDPLVDAAIVGEQNAAGNETQAQIVTASNGAEVCLVIVNSPDYNVSSGACTDPGALQERAERLSTGGTDTSISHWSEAKALAGGTGAFTWAQSDSASGSWAYAITPASVMFYADDTLGNDGNAGTSETSPWQTVNKVQTTLIGDCSDITVKFKRNETWGAIYTVAGYGTDGHPFLHTYYGSGNKPAIDGTGLTACVHAVSKNYVTLDSLELKNADTGLVASGCNYVIAQNLTVDGNLYSGIWFSGGGNCIVDTCIAYSNGTHNSDCGIGFSNVSYGEIKYCTSYDNNQAHDGYGIGLLDGTNHIYVHHNDCYGNGNYASDGTALEMYNADSCEIYCNIFRSSFNCVEWKYGSDNNRFYYNVLWGANDVCFELGVYSGVHSTGNEVYNNVLDANNKSRGMWISSEGNTFKNNIVFNISASGYAYTYDVPGHIGYGTLSNNFYEPNQYSEVVQEIDVGEYSLAAWQAHSGQDANSSTADPLFVDAPNHNYRIQPTSPCRDAGVDVELATDYFGTPVPQGNYPDIGIHEYVGKSGSSLVSGKGSAVVAVKKGGMGSVLAAAKGTLVAFGLAGMLGIAPISGNGQQVVIGQKGGQANIVLAGNGSIVATGSKEEAEAYYGTGLISGNGAVLSEGRKDISGLSIISGKGGLIAVGGKSGGGSSIISDGGTQAVIGNKGAQQDLIISGGGAISTEGMQLEFHSGLAEISGNGSLVSMGNKGAIESALISGKGLLVSEGKKSVANIVFVTGGGLQATVGVKGSQDTLIISGNGAILSEGIKAGQVLVLISRNGLIAATGEKEASGLILIPGAGNLTASGVKTEDIYSGVVVISGGGSFELSGKKESSTSVIITGNGLLVVAGKIKPFALGMGKKAFAGTRRQAPESIRKQAPRGIRRDS